MVSAAREITDRVEGTPLEEVPHTDPTATPSPRVRIEFTPIGAATSA
jgi:hypothetical protein